MDKKLARVGLCLGLIVSAAANAATYYVSPDGEDGASGKSTSQAWRTIGAANQRLTAGDTVYIRGGEYRGDAIEPARSGNEGAYITYAAYEDERPVLSDVSTAILLDGRSYIRIRGIDVDGGAEYRSASVATWIAIMGGGNNIIENGSFRYAKGWFGVRFDEGTHRNVLRDNEFDFVGTWSSGPSADPDSGDSMGILNGANRNLIEDNVFTRGGHNLLAVEGDYNVIRNNVFDNDWSATEGPGKGNRNLSIAKGRYNLFEGNIVRNAKESSDDAAPAAMKVNGRNQIVRRNLIVNNINEGMSTEAWVGRPHASSNRIYHNTFYDLGGPAWRLSVYDPSIVVDDNVFMNNLVVDHRRDPMSSNWNVDTLWQFSPSQYGLGSNRVLNNLFACGSCQGSHGLRGIAATVSTSDAESRFSDNFASAVQGVPQFVSVGTDDIAGFALKPGSPGIDEGRFLTHAVTDGSGSVVQVEDAGFFFAGATMVSGDVVAIGEARHMRVLAVDYESHTLTLDKDIAWQAGDGVTLQYFGAAPDIGAVESGATEMRKPQAPSWR